MLIQLLALYLSMYTLLRGLMWELTVTSPNYSTYYIENKKDSTTANIKTSDENLVHSVFSGLFVFFLVLFAVTRFHRVEKQQKKKKEENETKMGKKNQTNTSTRRPDQT